MNSLLYIYKQIRKRIFFLIFPNNFFYFSHKGYCPCCERKVVFRATDNWLRDNFICSGCGSIPRERALMMVIQKCFPDWKNLKIHESSPGNRGASLKLKKYCNQYIATQYYPDKPPGVEIGGFRNEDLEKQTFKDESFDLVITQDVMEHIFNPQSAFKEIARTLKKDGAHIFTVPIVNKHGKTETWAVKGDDGNPVFLNEPEYHSNPVNPKGSPVTMHWGFDIIDFIKEKSGMDTKIEYMDNLEHGIRAEFIEVLVSFKK